MTIMKPIFVASQMVACGEAARINFSAETQQVIDQALANPDQKYQESTDLAENEQQYPENTDHKSDYTGVEEGIPIMTEYYKLKYESMRESY